MRNKYFVKKTIIYEWKHSVLRWRHKNYLLLVISLNSSKQFLFQTNILGQSYSGICHVVWVYLDVRFQSAILHSHAISIQIYRSQR